MNNNVELCSDWLFHSAAHFSSPHSRKETQGGKYIFQYFLSQLHHRVIIQYAGIREPLLNHNHSISLYADDIILYLDHFDVSVSSIIKEFDNFSSLSGYTTPNQKKLGQYGKRK